MTNTTNRTKSQHPRTTLRRVWLELDPPTDAVQAAQTAELMNNMLKRLAAPDGVPENKFWWSPTDQKWCYGGPMGYTVCADNGHWFNLDYFGRPA
jgi:hypothetical protein